MSGYRRIAVVRKLLVPTKDKSAFLVIIIQPLIVLVRVQPDKSLSHRPPKVFRPDQDILDISSTPKGRVGDNPVQINGRISIPVVPDHPVSIGDRKTTGYLTLFDHLPV